MLCRHSFVLTAFLYHPSEVNNILVSRLHHSSLEDFWKRDPKSKGDNDFHNVSLQFNCQANRRLLLSGYSQIFAWNQRRLNEDDIMMLINRDRFSKHFRQNGITQPMWYQCDYCELTCAIVKYLNTNYISLYNTRQYTQQCATFITGTWNYEKVYLIKVWLISKFSLIHSQ